jgi:hypothetical protein
LRTSSAISHLTTTSNWINWIQGCQRRATLPLHCFIIEQIVHIIKHDSPKMAEK